MPKNIEQAATILRNGKICAFATETVYGLGADASNDDAVLAIYATKQRPRFNPLIVHCADIDMAKTLVEFSPLAMKLSKFWPGPLSLILPLKPNAKLSNIVSAGLDKLAIRIPNHPLAQELIKAVGKPLAAPSANPSGKLSPTSAEQVNKAFLGKVPVLDGGNCQAGLESTIIAIDGNRLIQLRAGALAREEIEKEIAMKIEIASNTSAIRAPGMLKSHYAPNANLRLNISKPKSDEAYLAFGKPIEFEGEMLNLSPSANLKQAAKNLFSYLHQLDETGVKTIAVAPIPNHGLGEAINDRLLRASVPSNETYCLISNFIGFITTPKTH